jgi:hypothetical protein
MVKKVVLHDRKILDRWAVFIEGAQGKAGEIYEETEKFLKDYNIPGLKLEMVKGIPKKGSGLFFTFYGKERDLLRVTCDALKEYTVYIGARDFGNGLDVSWFLTVEPKFLKSLVSSAIAKDYRALSLEIDPFEQQDLGAFATCVHRSLLKAVDNLMRSMGQDPSTIDRKSKGFLGVS